MRTISATLAALLVHLAILGKGAAACDLAGSPLDDPAVRAALADVVAVVEVTAVGDGAASAVVTSTLKGSPKKGDALVINGLLTRDEAGSRGDCGVASVDVGKPYVVTLWSPVPGSTKYDLVDPRSPAMADDAATRAAIAAALARHSPTSAWQASASGFQTRLALDPDARKGDVDLFVLARNIGPIAVTLVHKSWPEAQQTRCLLRIVDAANRAIDAQDVPIAKQDIAAYFMRSGQTYRVSVEPGHSHVISLRRVTTAASGWGYKEDLGFKYYPIVQHGPHSVAAECANFLGPGSTLTTATMVATL